MSSPFQLHLLRRTFAALAVASGFAFAGVAQAQGTVILSNGTSCTYSSMSITPNGNVNVTCSGSPPPPPPPPPPVTTETFSMSVASMPAAVGAIVSWDVVRAGPAGTVFGATTINFTYSGSGCAITGTYPVAFAAEQMTSRISAPMAGNGICTASLATPAPPAALGTPNSTIITVGTGGTPPPVGLDFSNCPAGYVPPANLLNPELPSVPGQLLRQSQSSGQIATVLVPTVPGWATGRLGVGERAESPQPVTIEISLNRCPGLIETDYTTACNLRSQFGHFNRVQWLARPYGGFGENSSPQAMAAYGLCWAGSPNTKYYVNVRWSYDSCPHGLSTCGFTLQWNQGDY